MLIGGLFLYTSYYGTDQSQVQRLFSAQDMGTVKKTLLFNGLLRFPITLIYCIMGLVIGTMVASQADFRALIPADKPDLMIPHIHQRIPSSWCDWDIDGCDSIRNNVLVEFYHQFPQCGQYGRFLQPEETT